MSTINRVANLIRTRNRWDNPSVARPARRNDRPRTSAEGQITRIASATPEAAAPTREKCARSSPRILVLSVSAGVGHLRAAQAVELALRETYPVARIVNVDVMQLTNAIFRYFYARTYFDLVQRVPHLIGFLYDHLDRPINPGRLDRAMAGLQNLHLRKLIELLESEPWDLAINTHFLPAEVIGTLRDTGRINFPQVTVTTDYYVHSMWVKQPVERYFAATEESAVNLAAYVPQTEIDVTGIPIHPDFSRSRDPRVCRRDNGLSSEGPVVLQMAGGLGIGPISTIHQSILDCPTPLNLVVATGRNGRARALLEAIPLPSHHRRTILGFTDRMPELMAAADVIVSKPGGLTTSEALATGTPMVVVDPIPGQESRNSDYLLEHNAAIKVSNLASLGWKLQSLLEDRPRLQRMSASARALGKPRAAYDIVEHSLELLESRQRSTTAKPASSDTGFQPVRATPDRLRV